MKSRLLLGAVPVAMMLTACQPATVELTEEQYATIEEEVRQAYADFDEAFQADDFDRWRSHLADDVRWGGGGSFVGIEQMVRGARAHMSEESEFSGETDELFVRVLGANAVLLAASFHGTTVLTNGESSSERTAMTAIWIRVDDVWKVVHGQFSSQPM